MRDVCLLRCGVCVAAGAVVLAGCGGRSRSAGPAPVNAGLERMARGGAAVEGSRPLAMPQAAPNELERMALDLEGLLRDRNGDGPGADGRPDEFGAGEADRPGASPGSTIAIDVVGDVEGEDAGELATGDEPGAGVTDAPAAGADVEAGVVAGEDTLDARIAERAGELAALLRERSVAGVTVDALGLAAMESIAPGALASSGLLEGLSPVERAHVEALAGLARGWGGASAVGTPALLEALEAAGGALRIADPQLRISEAVLCTRVVGFGKYDPAPRAFLAGQSHRVLVYCALEHFASREGSGDGMSTVELSQELTLYHDGPGDLQVWHRPRQRIVDASRRVRRDFFLLNEIELPRRLSVGAYRLRVTTRDEISGAEAEASIPIRMVADPALVGRG